MRDIVQGLHPTRSFGCHLSIAIALSSVTRALSFQSGILYFGTVQRSAYRFDTYLRKNTITDFIQSVQLQE